MTGRICSPAALYANDSAHQHAADVILQQALKGGEVCFRMIGQSLDQRIAFNKLKPLRRKTEGLFTVSAGAAFRVPKPSVLGS